MNRTDFILKCREVRSFIGKNGGASYNEIMSNVTDAKGCIMHLQKRRTIYLDKNLKWRIRPMDAVEYDVSADLSFENDDSPIKDTSTLAMRTLADILSHYRR